MPPRGSRVRSHADRVPVGVRVPTCASARADRSSGPWHAPGPSCFGARRLPGRAEGGADRPRSGGTGEVGHEEAPSASSHRVNEQIRAREVRLVGPEGEQVGIVPLERALQLAADVDLDLVEVAPMARPPVCKLMDFGKFKYESALKAREARRNQQQTVIKEMKLRPKIDPHDYETKKGHVVRFLKAGDKVKVTIMFRGREQSRPELGFRLLRRLEDEIPELGYVEAVRQAGRPKHDHGDRSAQGDQARPRQRPDDDERRARPDRRPGTGRRASSAERGEHRGEPHSTADTTPHRQRTVSAGAQHAPARSDGPIGRTTTDAEDEAPHRHGQAGQGDRHAASSSTSRPASATSWRSSPPAAPAA